ncbi:dTDP-4-amino-4,6-dideoxygalactose transaminase [Angulomicrobium tetraedrale]|uniref:dTDP-4-amino-4,6-dideoxygalactose transaminase n=1 Tax=Ancylobacter tetraedralis TaxID=217068 RepID=A0A839ZAA1_9HYPH|nr:DegT/DnrJ/EryC1/StrS family aminotransferase [Ancylobacter tetraedralis]MBB3771673.1 dTDP-4-amino-4,6-dideoxygalactose transaminase [Ancylobacter tetraedralis]
MQYAVGDRASKAQPLGREGAKPRIWEAQRGIRFPFVRPRLPELSEVDKFFEVSRQAGFYSNFGPVSIAFEEDLEAAFFPRTGAVACANCTVGISAALIAARVRGPVLVSAFTFPATLAAIRAAGLEPIICDVDAKTGVLDYDAASTTLGRMKCGAIVAGRPYGIWSDIGHLGDLARQWNVPLILDNAAGLGVGRHVVERYSVEEAFEVFSLHATKPFSVGEGGVVVGPRAFENDIRSALNFGLWSAGTVEIGSGFNGKMDELTASMARAVFAGLAVRVDERQSSARHFNRLAQAAGLQTFCAVGEEESSPWQCFPVTLPSHLSVEEVVAKCHAAGLQIRRYYYPLVGEVCSNAPVAGVLSDRTVCLPVYDGVEAGVVDEVWGIFCDSLAH